MQPIDIKMKTYNVTILKLFEAILSLKEEQQEEMLGLIIDHMESCPLD